MTNVAAEAAAGFGVPGCEVGVGGGGNEAAGIARPGEVGNCATVTGEFENVGTGGGREPKENGTVVAGGGKERAIGGEARGEDLFLGERQKALKYFTRHSQAAGGGERRRREN